MNPNLRLSIALFEIDTILSEVFFARVIRLTVSKLARQRRVAIFAFNGANKEFHVVLNLIDLAQRPIGVLIEAQERQFNVKLFFNREVVVSHLIRHGVTLNKMVNSLEQPNVYSDVICCAKTCRIVPSIFKIRKNLL